MSDLRGLDGARKYLEAMGGFDEHEVFPDDTNRLERVEAERPQIKFARHHDGSVVNLGAVPEQATGTIDGLPFYYRFRYDNAELRVFPARVEDDIFDHFDMPTLGVSPVLVSHVSGVTGEKYAGSLDDDEGVALMIRLIDTLHAPEGRDTYFLRIAASRKEDGPRNTGTDLAEAVMPLLPGSVRIELPQEQDDAGEAVLRLVSGVVLRLRQNDLFGDPTLGVELFTSDAKPFSRGDSAMRGAAPVAPKSSPEEIRDAFRAAVRAMTDESSFFNYTSELDGPSRRARQSAAINARQEIGRLIGVEEMTPSEVKAMEARATQDKGDLVHALFTNE